MKNEFLKEEYLSEAECKAAIKNYNSKNPHDKKYYLSYFNSYTRKRMYVPCTQQQFFDWRNTLAEERKQHRRETRCIVPSEKYNCFILCDKDCRDCPQGKLYKDRYVSIDRNCEKFEFEIVDESQPDILSQLIDEDLIKALKREISLLDAESQRILILHSQKWSDGKIGDELGIPRSTVQYKKTVAIEKLRNKLKDF